MQKGKAKPRSAENEAEAKGLASQNDPHQRVS